MCCGDPVMNLIKNTKLAFYCKFALVSVLMLPLCAVALTEEETVKKFKDLQTGIDAIVEKQRVQEDKINKKSEKADVGELTVKSENYQKQIAQLAASLEAYKVTLANMVKELELLKQSHSEKSNALHERIVKLEPRKITIDGQDVAVDLDELRAYEDSLQMLRENDYRGAKRSFTGFVTLYPQSVLLPSAHLFLGSANKGLNDCKESIAALQVVVTKYITNPKAPAAMLSMGTCQIELRDRAGAKKTFETIIEKFPESESANTAKNNLLLMK